MSNRKNIFTLNKHTQIEISDGYMRFNMHGGSCDIKYVGSFTLKQVAEIIRDITRADNGKWFAPCEHISFGVEFDEPEEDACVLEIIPTSVYMSFAIKESLLPALATFFFLNSDL
jgi:hypothetical protein